MLLTDPIAADFLENETHIEFFCHVARGSTDPKEPPTYEHVKFVGDFKYHSYVPASSCNGFDLAIPRTIRSSAEEQVCLVATVRLVTPPFLKDMCNVEEPCDEFTSRHSLEWKFLFLDHRGFSGDCTALSVMRLCCVAVMQFGKGKSCYYRFLTKGQQWIWLQTHYYITYHQWNSKPEFIVCTHTVVSYAEVRAERRRELGLEETASEMASSSIKSHEVYVDIRQCGNTQKAPREKLGVTQTHREKLGVTQTHREKLGVTQTHREKLGVTRTRSVSSPGSHKSSHTAMSDSASNSSLGFTETATQSCQSISLRPDTAASRIQPSSSQALLPPQTPSDLRPQQQHPPPPSCSQLPVMQPMFQFPAPLGVMHQLKEQLEERTRILQADIKTQQQELHDIKEQLQLVQDSNLQMFMQPPAPLSFSTVQHQGPGRPAHQQQSGVIRQPPALMGSEQYCGPHSSSPHTLTLRESSTAPPQVQQRVMLQHASMPGQTQASLTMPLYSNPMMFSQTNPRPGQISGTQDVGERHSESDFNQERQLRYAPDQQMTAPSLPMQPMSCSALIVPSPVFTSPIMIPQNSFLTHQTQPAYQQQPQAAQHTLQLQQHHPFFQMQPPVSLQSGPHPQQQSTMTYLQQQPQQQQLLPQNQTSSLPRPR
ncbi:UNVERIFIED_CONTAM: hypothetical protein FKN15_072257 [Acipenser sinensis]